jgi:shikimate dehydrogenase
LSKPDSRTPASQLISPPHTYRLAVLGDPVAHSLSPAMHAAALAQAGLLGSYEPIRAAAGDLPDVVRRLHHERYDGFNVTVPHKQRIMPLLDVIDPAAAHIGAVNTVVRDGDLLVGFNTDASGFGRILDELAGTREVLHRELITESNPKVVVLGAGGAARACVHALSARGWSITVANRTRAHAREAFGGAVGCVALTEIDKLTVAVGQADLLVNATSAGMNRPDESPLPNGIDLPLRLTVIDLVYAPLETKLLSDSRHAGCHTLDGLALLAAQAADAFELWTGNRLPDTFFRQAAESALPDSSAANRRESEASHVAEALSR